MQIFSCRTSLTRYPSFLCRGSSFEFAAYDGCQIAWSTVQVNATCLGCTIDVADAAPVVVNDFDQSLHGWTPVRRRAILIRNCISAMLQYCGPIHII